MDSALLDGHDGEVFNLLEQFCRLVVLRALEQHASVAAFDLVLFEQDRARVCQDARAVQDLANVVLTQNDSVLEAHAVRKETCLFVQTLDIEQPNPAARALVNCVLAQPNYEHSNVLQVDARLRLVLKP